MAMQAKLLLYRMTFSALDYGRRQIYDLPTFIVKVRPRHSPITLIQEEGSGPGAWTKMILLLLSGGYVIRWSAMTLTW